MNKRTFLKLLSGAAGGTLLAWARDAKLTNWAGNIEYSTDKVYQPATLAEVCGVVKQHSKLKALGTRHCFNTIADSRHGFVSLKAMDDGIVLDPAARTVTVSGGVTYGKLSPYLHEKGFALHNLASLPHISVAGACATATHGSGEKNGNLSSAVSAFEMVTAAGEVVQLSRAKDGDAFAGAVVGLGALGVVTKVTLNLQPTFLVKQYVYENMPTDQAMENFDKLEASAYSVSLFMDWQKHRINEVWVKSRQEDGALWDAAPAEFFGAQRATRNLHPIAELSAENCTEQLGVPGPWYERLPHFRMGFTPSAGKELQTEYLVPRKHAVEAILAVERLRDQISPHLLITEIRTIAADDLWMSSAYQRESVAIHFTWQQDWPAVSKLLPVIERELGPFEPRPHWGKLAAMRGEYAKREEFVALAKRFDLHGKFRNEFLDKFVF